ncbi:MAG TPA: hypothetical protein VGH28_24050 [Polyangiaceae bacterium]
MSEKIAWQETKRPGGTSVTFAGPAASAARAWVGAAMIAAAALFGYLAYLEPNAKPAAHQPWFRVAPIVLVLAGVALAATEWPGISAGTLDVDRARIRIEPAAAWRLQVEVPLANVEAVATESGDATGTGRFRVRVTLRDGTRTTLAIFGEADAALFMAQRLEGLIDRARATQITG